MNGNQIDGGRRSSAAADNDLCALLSHAESCLAAGAEGEARDALLQGCRHPANNPHSLRRWAQICQELGMARQAKECYQWALRLDAKDAETHCQLALLLTDVGDHEGAIRHLKKAIGVRPDHSQARRLLAENYAALGLPGQAQALGHKPPEHDAPRPERYFPPSVSERDTRAFLRLFAGREIGYCTQHLDAANADALLQFQDAPLTDKAAAAHLAGDITLAAYPLRSDNTACYVALVLRPPGGVLQSNRKNQGYLLRLHEKMRHHLGLLTLHCNSLGLPVYPEQRTPLELRLW